MRVELIVTDLDNTLLRSDKTISEYTLRVLLACRERGARIVYATARPMRALRQFSLAMRPDATIIHNGAGVYLGDKEIAAASIPHADAESILGALKRLDPQNRLSAEIGDELYANFDASVFWKNAASIRTDFSRIPEAPVYKIIAELTDRARLAAIRELLPASVYAEEADGKLALVMERSATKMAGIRLLAEAWGVPLARAVAFGDDNNDIGMLEGCGVGVAMENAIPEAKAAANCVCAANDADGVARWLAENVLIGG